MTLLAPALCLALAASSLPACRDANTRGARSTTAEDETLHGDDLAGIRGRGVLRILVQRAGESWLPRNGSPLGAERDRATALADALGLNARFVAVPSFEDLIPALLEGRGDLIVENLTVTPARSAQVTFSKPVSVVREEVVVRATDAEISGPEQLAGRTLSVQESSSFWQSATALRERVPGLSVEPAPEDLDADGLLDAVAAGQLDATLMDSNVMDAALAWRDNLRVAFDLGEDRMIAWAMRPDAPELRKAVDAFLARAPLDAERRAHGTYADDLPGIRKRGVLRVITRNGGSTYFIARGELVGFEYDLARRFASELGLRLEMVVPPTWHDLIPWLHEGRGDLIAAGLSASPERAERQGVAFSRTTHEVREVVVSRTDPTMPERIADLDGRSIAVRRSSSYWQHLEALQRDGLAIELIAAPEQLETEEIIARVADGRYDLTVADSHVLAVAESYRDDIAAAFELGEPVQHGWAVRPGDASLLAAIDDFFRREYRGLFYNVTRKKYFERSRRMRERVAARPVRSGWISPFDSLVREYAPRYGFDWRLVVAQISQESRFDPKARSFAGARGLLQVMPRTARELGYSDLDDPETGLRAGLEYMRWVRDRFDRRLPASDRTWLTLAAYNVGPGHVRDARRIAESQGWDPDRWFGHVEQAMLLKEDPAVHRKTRFGYARGREPVEYVRSIRDRYEAYLQSDTPVSARR